MTKDKSQLKPLKGPMYAVLYPFMAGRAQACGYALALHGSLATDMDLVAVPWTEDAVSPEELVAKILEWMGDTVFVRDEDKNGIEGEKPHGRRCWTLHLNAWVGAYVDLSIMPRRPPKGAFMVGSVPPEAQVDADPTGE